MPALEGAPQREFYVQPGLEGIYAELRAVARLSRKCLPQHGGGSGGAGKTLARYHPYESPATPADPAAFNIRQIVVKFVEGSSVRLRGGVLVVSADAPALETRARLARQDLEPQNVAAELAVLGRLLKTSDAVAGRAAPQIDELDLTLLRRRAEQNTGLEQPELNLFYFIHLPQTGAEAAQRTLAELKGLRIVETVYFQPIPVNAQDKPPTTTISVINAQDYFMPAPGGVDVNFARNFAGGRGEGMRVADIEYGWNFLHEDLPPTGFGFGINFSHFDHGTAVLGQIAARENAFGATGIVPNAMIGWSSTTNLDPFLGSLYIDSVANAILMTGYALRPGDIALIEQQFAATATSCEPAAAPCGDCTGFGLLMVEEFAYEHGAISMLTGAGIIVVEAAGNGKLTVTPASTTDSGAIVVGASTVADGRSTLTPACFTNFGPRVNVHSWGMNIGTTGFGSDITLLRANGDDFEQWYTRSFGGTSGASPIITGAAALIQSIRAAAGLPKLTSVEMRTLLVATGTPQAAGSKRRIGAHPNLRAAIETFINPDIARFVSQSAVPSGPLAPGALFPMSVTFANSGGIPWQGTHTILIDLSSASQPQFAGAPITVGTASAPINPGQTTTQQFSLAAPTQPGTYGLVFVLRSGSGRRLAASPQQQIVVAAPKVAFDNASLTIKISPASMPRGDGRLASVNVRNTGTTTWAAANYTLRLGGTFRLMIQPSAPLPGNIAPGAAQDIFFVVFCNSSSGQGSYWAQMSGPGGPFGLRVVGKVVCQ